MEGNGIQKENGESLHFPIASDFRDSTVKRMALEANHSDQEAGQSLANHWAVSLVADSMASKM